MPKTKITNQDYSKWWGEFLKISSLDWQDLLDSQSEKPLPSNIPMDILTEEFDKDPLKFILFSGTLPQREAKWSAGSSPKRTPLQRMHRETGFKHPVGLSQLQINHIRDR